MEILKNVILALHIIGVVALLGGVVYQSSAMREKTARIVPTMMHGAWTMLVTGIVLVGMQYALGRGDDVNNVKITVKLVVLIAIVVIALINRKKDPVAGWVLPAIGLLTVANIVMATVWR